MNLQPTLENNLILLRPLSHKDFDELYEVAKDPLIWEQHPNNERYQLETFTEFFNDSIQSNGALVVINKFDNKIIGSSRYNPLPHSDDAIEIGWSFLSRKYWGGLYNKSIKKLMIDYAFDFVSEIIFYIGNENIRSQRAVEKIGGYRITDPQFKHLIKNSKIDWTYRINKKDWEIINLD